MCPQLIQIFCPYLLTSPRTQLSAAAKVLSSSRLPPLHFFPPTSCIYPSPTPGLLSACTWRLRFLATHNTHPAQLSAGLCFLTRPSLLGGSQANPRSLCSWVSPLPHNTGPRHHKTHGPYDSLNVCPQSPPPLCGAACGHSLSVNRGMEGGTFPGI